MYASYFCVCVCVHTNISAFPYTFLVNNSAFLAGKIKSCVCLHMYFMSMCFHDVCIFFQHTHAHTHIFPPHIPYIHAWSTFIGFAVCMFVYVHTCILLCVCLFMILLCVCLFMYTHAFCGVYVCLCTHTNLYSSPRTWLTFLLFLAGSFK
jgi:hypothetical protein